MGWYLCTDSDMVSIPVTHQSIDEAVRNHIALKNASALVIATALDLITLNSVSDDTNRAKDCRLGHSRW